MCPGSRSKVRILARVSILAGCLCCRAITYRGNSNPSYQGKPLSYWFNQLPMTSRQVDRGREIPVQCARRQARHIKSGAVQQYGTWLEAPEVSAEAIRTIGTNGLSFHFSKLERPEGPLPSKLQKTAFDLGFRRFLFADVSAERQQAVTALILPKPLPESPVRRLSALSTNSNAGLAGAAHCVLVTEPGKLPRIQNLDEAIRRSVSPGTLSLIPPAPPWNLKPPPSPYLTPDYASPSSP
jgi:hypothetical protein